MEVKLDVRNIDLREAQEKVGDNIKQARQMSRKAVLAYVGLVGLAIDEARELMERGKKLVEEAEERGEKLEKQAVRQVKDVRKQAEKRLETVEKRLEKVQKRAVKRVEKSEAKAEKELESQVERVLERLGIPSRERIVRLSEEIEALSKKIDEQIVAQAPKMAEPFEGYDELTAKEIVARLEELAPEQLTYVKEYEVAHENRVTILREVDRRLEALTAPAEEPVAA